MSEFTFKLEQDDADEYSFSAAHAGGSNWRTAGLSTADAVALYEAVDAGIGEYVREMRAARREFDAGCVGSSQLDPEERGFEGHGDFTSDDPMERYIAHQAAKGNL